MLSAFLLSGCSFRLASSVDELISPVSPQGEDADVQNALSSYISGGYTLKTPSGGEFTTAFSFYDFDGDSQEEAIVFYEPEKTPGMISMAVIDKVSGSWTVTYNISSTYSYVYSLSFSDLTGDGVYEFIVLWDVISNSTSHVLSVYQQELSDEFALTPLGDDITVNSFISLDMNLDSVNEILAFTIDSGDTVSAYATLYGYSDSGRKTLGSTRLDGHITYYDSIQYYTDDDRVYVYADAVKSDGTQMLTEVIYWSDYYDTIISPFYSYSTGITSATTRSVMVSCDDVDEDGTIEIPCDSDKTSVPSEVYAVNWKRYNSSVLVDAYSSLVVAKDQYQVIIPDEYFDDIHIDYSSESALLTVSDSEDNLLFSVMCVLKTQYNESAEQYSDYTVVQENSGYVYLVQTGESGEADFSADALKTLLKTDKGE